MDIPSRGRFVASAAGRDLLARTPPRIDVALLETYPAFRAFYRGTGTAPKTRPTTAPAPRRPRPSLSRPSTPEEQIEAAYAALQATLRDELLARMLQNGPAFFGQVIVSLLVAMG